MSYARPLRPVNNGTHLPDIEREHVIPPVPALWVEEIDPDATSRPTPTLEIRRLVVPLRDDVLICGVLVDSEAFGLFDVRIDDRDHLERGHGRIRQ